MQQTGFDQDIHSAGKVLYLGTKSGLKRVMSFTLKNKSKMLLKLNENVAYFLPNHRNI